MKDLKAFFEDLSTNESLAKKFEGIKETDKIVALAKEEGYEFTKKEFDAVMLEMVSGGVFNKDAYLDKLKKNAIDSLKTGIDVVSQGGSLADAGEIVGTQFVATAATDALGSIE